MPLDGNTESGLLMMDGERIARITDLGAETVSVQDDGRDLKRLCDRIICDEVLPLSKEAEEKIRKYLVPQGFRNARILKRDGYLDVGNADMD